MIDSQNKSFGQTESACAGKPIRSKLTTHHSTGHLPNNMGLRACLFRASSEIRISNSGAVRERGTRSQAHEHYD